MLDCFILRVSIWLRPHLQLQIDFLAAEKKSRQTRAEQRVYLERPRSMAQLSKKCAVKFY
jgi:hypothetical protein